MFPLLFYRIASVSFPAGNGLITGGSRSGPCSGLRSAILIGPRARGLEPSEDKAGGLAAVSAAED